MKLNSFIHLLVAHFCAVSLMAHEDHDGLRHWEIPSKDPDRIILTFHGDPSTSRAVTWRTDKTVTKAVAQVAEATVNSKFTSDDTEINAVTEAFDLGQYKRNSSLIVHYHSVRFQGLKPDTLYVYRVGDGSKHWSEWIQFRTAKSTYAPIQFVYFGDAQNDILDHWSRVIRMAYQTAPNASFAIHAGDLVNIAHRDHEWAQWFKAGGFLHSQWTAIPAVGNHEFSAVNGGSRRVSIQWRPQFTLPVEKSLDPELHETVYSVDYQDVRIIVLNSNEKLEQQTKYLEDQLKNCTAKWKIVTCHHSVFSSARGSDFKFARENWKPLLDKYNVDLVLNGHDHTYARGHVPIRTSESDTPELGTVYVTSVSGPKQYGIDRQQILAYKSQGYRSDKTAEQTQFFQVITIEDKTLSYVAYTVTGDEYDRATITKDFVTGKKSLTGKVIVEDKTPAASPQYWWNSSEKIGYGFYENWLGQFMPFASGWIYHLRLGWVYVIESDLQGLWMWMPTEGWLWTEGNLWPFIWSNRTTNWIRYMPSLEADLLFDYSSRTYR